MPAVPAANHSRPSSVVHTRREPGNNHAADKIVMAQSHAVGNNKSFVTIAAHTGSTLFHSHSVDATAIVNYWWGGARFLGSPGKHDMSPDHANHVVMQRGPATTPTVFPLRNISDMLAVAPNPLPHQPRTHRQHHDHRWGYDKSIYWISPENLLENTNDSG